MYTAPAIKMYRRLQNAFRTMRNSPREFDAFSKERPISHSTLTSI